MLTCMEAEVKSLRRAEIRPPGSELTSSHSCPWEELGGSSTLVCCWWYTPSIRSPVYNGHRSRQAPSEFLFLSSELKSLLTKYPSQHWPMTTLFSSILAPRRQPLLPRAGIHQLSAGWRAGGSGHPHVWSWTTLVFPSVRFSRSVVSDSLWPHELQDTRLPCPSPTPRAYSNSCPSHLVMPSNHLILCCPLLFPPSIFPSIRVFSNESVLHIRWPKYWSLSIRISPFNEYSGLISFRIDWLDLLAVQGTLKSLLQHHSSKASVLPRSAFLIVQLSHPYMTTGKIIALTRQTFVGKTMTLLYNMLSRFSLIGALSVYLHFWLRFFS